MFYLMIYYICKLKKLNERKKKTMQKKVTKKDRFIQLQALVQDNKDLLEFVNHEIELLDKKNGTPKKPTATQMANVGIKEDIVKCMEVGQKYTITEMIKKFEPLHEYTNQKISNLANSLVMEGVLVKTVEGRNSYFAKVAQ